MSCLCVLSVLQCYAFQNLVLWCASLTQHQTATVVKTVGIMCLCTAFFASCSKLSEQAVSLFCRPDQIKPELNRFLQMLKVVYDTFGLHYKMALSTRPEEKLGDDAMWDQAEGALQGALDDTGLDWEVSRVVLM